MTFERNLALTLSTDVSNFAYSFTCDWIDAATMLCDSVIGSVRELSLSQVFSCLHPRLGEVDVTLCALANSVVMTNCDIDTLERLQFEEAFIEEIEASGPIFTFTKSPTVLRLAASK